MISLKSYRLPGYIAVQIILQKLSNLVPLCHCDCICVCFTEVFSNIVTVLEEHRDNGATTEMWNQRVSSISMISSLITRS